MKKVVVSLVGAAALATITAGMAGGISTVASTDNSFFNNADSGFFVGGNLGYGKVDFTRADLGVTPSSRLETGGFSWNANAGYQFNQFLAVEGGYTQFDDAHALVGSTKVGYRDIDGWSMLVKGMYPVNQQISVFAKFGTMRLHLKPVNLTGVTLKRWAPELGLGVAYHLNKNISLEAQGVTTFRIHQSGGRPATPATYAFYAGASYLFSA